MRFVIRVGVLLVCFAAVADELQVVEVAPQRHSLGASVHTPVVVLFDRAVNPATVDAGSFRAFGRWSGAVDGTYSFALGGRAVTLTPTRALSAGENVMVLLSHDLEAADGSPMRPGGYFFQFWTRGQPAPMSFLEIDRLTTRSIPSQPTQAYGGIASDLDGDGHLDVTIVNEITADLRVFMNKADGTGLLEPFVQPPFAVGNRASPSEASDFNRDGAVDIAVANIDDDTVSVLLGNGDGTFLPQQTIAVGDAPRGIAVLDADGDGDVDIVNTNAGASPLNMTLLLNDGNGVFGAATFFASGGAGAWALGSADLDDDGFADLVVGARDSQRIIVLRGQGDGTFVQSDIQASAGRVWMLVLGDVDGDGDEDVATVNSFDDNGAILLGNGNGELSSPQVYPTDPFSLATDLGDLDGDGDLDWVTSSFSGDWFLYENAGDGTFAFLQEFDALQASSCSLLLDLEGDGDLDLALIDEIADEVILMQNGGVATPADPPVVPDGSAGTDPLRVGKLDPAGESLALHFDVDSCTAVDYHLVHGVAAGLPASPGQAYIPTGGRCGVGTTQPFHWIGTPDPSAAPGDLIWFVLVATDGEGTEGSWGAGASGEERAGPGPGGASLVCGVVGKDPATACSP